MADRVFKQASCCSCPLMEKRLSERLEPHPGSWIIFQPPGCNFQTVRINGCKLVVKMFEAV